MEPNMVELLEAYYEKQINELHKIYPHELPPSFFINLKKIRAARDKALREARERS